MKKSSRFWWLHGAILMAAVVGCKSSSCCNSNPYGSTGPSGPPPAIGSSGPIGSASGMTYNQSAMSGGMTGGMTGGQSFAPQGGGAQYGGPGLSSGVGGH